MNPILAYLPRRGRAITKIGTGSEFLTTHAPTVSARHTGPHSVAFRLLSRQCRETLKVTSIEVALWIRYSAPMNRPLTVRPQRVRPAATPRMASQRRVTGGGSLFVALLVWVL